MGLPKSKLCLPSRSEEVLHGLVFSL